MNIFKFNQNPPQPFLIEEHGWENGHFLRIEQSDSELEWLNIKINLANFIIAQIEYFNIWATG